MPTTSCFQDSDPGPGVQPDPEGIDGLTRRSCIQRAAAQPPTQNVQAPMLAMLTPARWASHGVGYCLPSQPHTTRVGHTPPGIVGAHVPGPVHIPAGVLQYCPTGHGAAQASSASAVTPPSPGRPGPPATGSPASPRPSTSKPIRPHPATSNATHGRIPQRTPNHRSSGPMNAIGTAAVPILRAPPVTRSGGCARRGPGTPDEPRRVMAVAGSCRQAPAAVPPHTDRRTGGRGQS